MRKTYVRQNSINRYYKLLNEVKDRIDKNSVTSLHDLLRKHNVSNDWNTFLKLHNIVYKNQYGFFEWNKSIAVSIKLVQKYRAYKSELNKKYRVNNNQPEIKFDMPQTPLPPKPKTRTKPYKDKMKEKVNNAKQLKTPIQQNEYGVIRKFLKWLW